MFNKIYIFPFPPTILTKEQESKMFKLMVLKKSNSLSYLNNIKSFKFIHAMSFYTKTHVRLH